VPAQSRIVGQTLHHLTSGMEKGIEIVVAGLIRDGQHMPVPSWYEVIQANDILMVEANPEDLKALIDTFKLELAECKGDCRTTLGSDDIRIIEAIVAPDSPMANSTAISLNLRRDYGVNLLAVARQGHRLQQRLGQTRLVIGDILLLQGSQEALRAVLKNLRCLPLAERSLRLDSPRKVLLSIGIFAAAMLVTALNLVPVQVAFVLAALIMIGVQIVPLEDIYASIDWPIIVLLGAMFPIGGALETSGGAALVADQLLRLSAHLSPALVIAVILAGTMLLSNVVNNAAAAVLMAPIAIGLAEGLQVSADPLLMAVAIGASCAFLTPVGHQSNALVMAPGGYRFGDYWRMGLPLSVIVTVVAVPLILYVWPM
jgi:di/tricarboxylate transporter